MAKILVVEDDEDLLGLIAENLQFEHYGVDTCTDGEEAFARLRFQEYDLVIIDWDLPNVTGVEICRKYRKLGGSLPLLMLTGKSAVIDKVTALDSGVDDYLNKPFNLLELNARVRALLRRGTENSGVLKIRDLVMEPNNYSVSKGGIELKLIKKEFLILELLMRYPGKVFTPESIINRVWKDSSFPAPDVVRGHVMNLRRKLGNSLIETVHSIGYKIPAE